MRLSLDRWRAQVAPKRRWVVVFAAAISLVAFAAVLLSHLDTSRPLNAAEARQLALFVELTGDPFVRAVYDERSQDGRLTLEEARIVLETAKAHGPGYGLAGNGDSD